MPVKYVKKRSFPKNEREFIKEFMNEFVKIAKPAPWFFKTHGEPMQARGIPDILMCYRALFIGIEFKIMRNGKVNVTPYQYYTIDMINKSLGFGFVIWYDEANQGCGINAKRLDGKKECAAHLLELLNAYANVAPCNYREIKG